MSGSPSGVRQPSDDREEIDLLRLISPLRQYWLRFLVVWVIAGGVVGAAILSEPPEFTSTGSLYVADASSSGGMADALSSILPGGSQDADIESQKEILTSAHLATHVIRRLGLNATLEGDEHLVPSPPVTWRWRLKPDPTVYASGLRVSDSDLAADVYAARHFDLTFSDERTFTVAARGETLATGVIGEPVVTDEARFVLNLDGPVRVEPGSEVRLSMIPATQRANSFATELSVTGGGTPSSRTSVLEVTYRTSSPLLAPQVVQALMDEYVDLRHKWATGGATRTLDFVTTQIDTLQAEMDDAAQRLSRFQQESSIIDLSPQIESRLRQMVSYEAELSKQQLQLNEIRKLTESLRSGDQDQYLLVFVQDDSIQDFVRQLSNINLQIASLETSYTDDYKPLRDLRLARSSVVSDLRKALENAGNRLEVTVESLQARVDEARDQMTLLPEQARALTEYERRTRVFGELYVFLFQQQQKARIAVESTLTPIRQIDEPRVNLTPSSPRVTTSVVLALAAGFLLAVLTVAGPILRIRWYLTVDEVKRDTGLPVFAVAPHRGAEARRATLEIVERDAHSAFLEAMRLLRTNIVHTMAARKHQSILITSAMPGDGKTSISANLAITIGRSRRLHTVILIDADMHRPALHGVFGIKQSPGLSDYLNGEVEIDDILHEVELDDGQVLHVIAAGPIPPTPADLIETQRMRDLLTWCEERFTFTLIDSPPFPLVSTASILAPLADRILTICRIGQTDRYVFRHHVEELQSVNPSMGLVANVTMRSHTAYGSYGYGYGYGDRKAYGKQGGKPSAAPSSDEANDDRDGDAPTAKPADTPSGDGKRPKPRITAGSR